MPGEKSRKQFPGLDSDPDTEVDHPYAGLGVEYPTQQMFEQVGPPLSVAQPLDSEQLVKGKVSEAELTALALALQKDGEPDLMTGEVHSRWDW